ncbi:MAG: low specificity L-threonine aldolase [Defluviitaleaceae bacterium]|nr:low specificity L-threonine aldolase [Defluviitaleaceae bacterium]
MIDLRSDTVSMPTQEMLEEMIKAEMGDDVYEDDKTANKLEDLAAKTMGKEAALFVPSGTMGNQIAIMCHTKRGDEILLDKNSHIVVHEVGAAALLSGVGYRVTNNPKSYITKEDFLKNVRGDDIHEPSTGLVCIENALGNGTVVPLNIMKELYDVAKEKNIQVHLDGARIFNAATYLKVDVKEISKYVDSIMFCLSKGLCSPVGSILCGSLEFIKRARKTRKLLGGGMRQIGSLASCGIISIEKMTKRLHIDHENAKYLASELEKIQGITTDIENVHINMVFFDFDVDSSKFVKYMHKNEVKIHPPELLNTYRFVTHNDISKENLDKVIKLIKNFKTI